MTTLSGRLLVSNKRLDTAKDKTSEQYLHPIVFFEQLPDTPFGLSDSPQFESL